jgi:hypothetical protein
MTRSIVAALLVWSLFGISGSVPAQTLAPRPGQVLIQRLIAIAESGKATDASYVGAVLQLDFSSRAETMAPFSTSCAPGYQKKPTDVVYHTAAQPLPLTQSGRSPVTVPGFGNPSPSQTIVSGPAKVSYFVIRFHDCSGYVQSSNDVEATLDIGPLSAYDCITTAELNFWFPRTQQLDATDGALVYYYGSKQTERNGASLTFTSSVGAPCLMGVTLTQRSSDVPRHQAARQRQESCMLPHMEAFCRSHPPFDWAAGDVQDEMASYAVRQCGALDKFIAGTPENARLRETPTPVEQGVSTPCSRVRARLALEKRR